MRFVSDGIGDLVIDRLSQAVEATVCIGCVAHFPNPVAQSEHAWTKSCSNGGIASLKPAIALVDTTLSKAQLHIELEPAIVGAVLERPGACSDGVRLIEEGRVDVPDDRSRIEVVKQIAR